MLLPRKYCFRPCLFFFQNAHVHSAVEYNHYKTLGLNPSATKNEIKAAYYELSKKHHPDRNQGSDESARIFRLVREAYEVLGNEKKRMQYDKECIFNVIRRPVSNYPPDNNADYKDEIERIHFQNRIRPSFRRYSYGKTSYYDFDAWYEGHYGKQAKFEFKLKAPRHFKCDYQYETINKEKQFASNIKFVMVFFLYVMIFLSLISLQRSSKKSLETMILKMISLQGKVFKRIVQIGVRNIYINSILRKNLYETLGLTRNATQADIKNAYFELTKLYHPDRITATDENLAKFREITAAYEILSNEQSRKLYDRGLLDYEKGIDEPDEIIDPIIKFYKKRQDLSKSLAKTTEDVEAWARTYFKEDKPKFVRKQMIFKKAPVDTLQAENPFLLNVPILVLFVVIFLFMTNFEDTKSRKVWNKIFNSN